jgi:hypothetical protein
MKAQKLSKLFWLRIKKEPMAWKGLAIYLVIVITLLYLNCKTDSMIIQLIIGLSCGYIASMILYILSIFYPMTRKSRYILPIIVEDIRALKKEYEEVGKFCHIKSCPNNIDDTVKIDKIIEKMQESIFEDDRSLNDEAKRLLNNCVVAIKNCSNILFSYETYLSDEECRLMAEIQMSFSTWQIENQCNNISMDDTRKKFLKDIIVVYYKICELEKLMSIYRCDFQYDINTNDINKTKMNNKRCKSKIFEWLSRYIDIVMVACFLLIIVGPYLFSQIHIFGDFSNTGDIGNTIGGITAPFIGVLSIILLYLTLKSQQQQGEEMNRQVQKMNKQQQEMNEKGNITLLCNHLIECIDNFHYTAEDTGKDQDGPIDSPNPSNPPDPSNPPIPPISTTQEKKTIEKKGAEAIASYLRFLYCHKSGLSFDQLTCDAIDSELINILTICNSCNELLDNSSIQDKNVFKILITNQFEYRIYPEIKNIKIERGENGLKRYLCDECHTEHGFDDKIIQLIEELIRKLIKTNKTSHNMPKNCTVSYTNTYIS